MVKGATFSAIQDSDKSRMLLIFIEFIHLRTGCQRRQMRQQNMDGAVAILFLLSVWPTAILQLGKFKAWLIRCIKNIAVDIASCLAHKHIY
jgi:hypothetical protein